MQYHFNALQPNFEPVIRLYQHATQPYPRQLCRQLPTPCWFLPVIACSNAGLGLAGAWSATRNTWKSSDCLQTNARLTYCPRPSN